MRQLHFECPSSVSGDVLGRQLNEQRQAEMGATLCDVILTSENRRIIAHRCVLAAKSPYFRAMFANKMKMEGEQSERERVQAISCTVNPYYNITPGTKKKSDVIQGVL